MTDLEIAGEDPSGDLVASVSLSLSSHHAERETEASPDALKIPGGRAGDNPGAAAVRVRIRGLRATHIRVEGPPSANAAF